MMEGRVGELKELEKFTDSELFDLGMRFGFWGKDYPGKPITVTVPEYQGYISGNKKTITPMDNNVKELTLENITKAMKGLEEAGYIPNELVVGPKEYDELERLQLHSFVVQGPVLTLFGMNVGVNDRKKGWHVVGAKPPVYHGTTTSFFL